jgi:hypothetical protein
MDAPRLLAVATVCATLLSVSGTAEARADELVAQSFGTAQVKAHDGRVVWSSQARPGGRWRLWTSYAGRVEPVPGVRSRGMPFDVDVGPDANGRTVAVYSRCRRDSDAAAVGGRQANFSAARGCDVFLYDFRSRRERRLAATRAEGGSEYLPTIWGRRVAFVRIHERRRGLAGVLPHIYVYDLARGTTRVLRAGGRGVYVNVGSAEDPDWFGGAGPTAMDLRGRTLAVGWEAHVRRCGSAASSALIDRAEIWLLAADGRGRTRAAAGCYSPVFSPQLAGRHLYFASDRGRAVTRFEISTRGTRVAQTERGISSFARDGRLTYYESTPPAPASGSAIYRADSLPFGPRG